MGTSLLRFGLWVVLTCALGWSAPAQTATQVPAGSSTAMGQTTASKSKLPDTPEGRRIFKDAQSPEVRRTLQEAIDATPAPAK